MARELTAEQQGLLQQCLADVAGCRPPAPADWVCLVPDTAQIALMAEGDREAQLIRIDSIARSGPLGWRQRY